MTTINSLLFKHTVLLLSILNICLLHAQVLPNQGQWQPVGNATITTVYSDQDNTDGVADGAIFVDGKSAVVGQGVTFTFTGQMTTAQNLTFTTYTFNVNSSYVRFQVELYNLTDNTSLDSEVITILGNDPNARLTTLSYNTGNQDAGDILQLRYIRTDDGNTARNFAIDNAKLNGTFLPDLSSTPPPQQCPFTVTPDIPLVPSNNTIEAQINQIYNKYSDSYLGTSPPSAAALTSATNAYNNLNISVSGNTISGSQLSVFRDVEFLRTFAQHLKFNPNDATVKQMAERTIWLTSKQFCDGTLAKDGIMYSYRYFARPAILLKDVLNANQKGMFEYTLYKHADDFKVFWEPNYDAPYQTANDAIDTDEIYNLSDVLMAYAVWQDTPEERLQYIKGFQRYLERFFSHSYGTSNGIKKDGSGFHHWTAYDQYMYAYITATLDLHCLADTDFQVGQSHYLFFRDAVMAHMIKTNDANYRALSICGRIPQSRKNNLNSGSHKRMAIVGGKILNLNTADPVLAGLYNRRYGVDPAFNYSTIASFDEGFYQFNHSHLGLYRKNNWVATNKGFSDNMWGAEIYTSNNRYGRYQSYGALEIMYPGDLSTGNGFDVNTWDWNFQPGATVIHLSFAELHAERGRIDELQQKRFAGSLTFQNQGSSWLTNNRGNYGLFAMDFQEKDGQGFGVTHGPDTHNNTFKFKKSSFYFDDLIVCLGSGISNDDTNSPTVTTLYQRLNNSGNNVLVNNVPYTGTGTSTVSGNSNNWVLSNYGTGFYLMNGSHNIKIKTSTQQTPNQNQTNPADASNNPTATYCVGYLDHGTAPSGKSYEYIIKPAASAADMQSLDNDIQNNQKPYTVHQQNAVAHIVEQSGTNIWGYSFFTNASNLTHSEVKSVDNPCLLMHQNDLVTNEMLLSINYPDLGFQSRSYAPGIPKTVVVTLHGEWQLAQTYSNVTLVSSNPSETVLSFYLADGLATEILLNKGFPDTELDVRLWMEGVYDSTTDDLAKANLQTMGLLPGQTPANPLYTATPAGQPYNVLPWNYPGTEGQTWTDSDYPADMVDWVYVSLRKTPLKTDEYFRGVALLLKDGRLELVTPLRLDLSLIDQSYILVAHRHHLKALSAVPALLDPIQGTLVYDFTTQNSYVAGGGFGQKELKPGSWGLYAGDILQVSGGDINANDRSEWAIENGSFGIYSNADLNLDGDINALDHILWFNNNGIFSTVQE